jgi:S1-C subfamily serine protease
MANGSSKNLLIASGLLKAVAMAIGFVGTLIGLLAAFGALIANGWIVAILAIGVGVGVPLVIADRLLPDNPLEGKGIVTDVFAIAWLGFAFVFTAALQPTTKPLLVGEGDRLTASGWIQLGRAAYFLAGVKAGEPGVPTESPVGSGSASAAAPPSSANPAPEDAGAAPPAHVDAPKSGGAEKTPAQLFKELAPSVVTIFVDTGLGEGGGTGFVVDATGTIVTNHHVVAGASGVRIKFLSGTVYDVVELLSDDTALDLALLHIDSSTPSEGGAKVDLTPLALGDSDAVVVGERAISIGNPLGLEHTLTDGLVSARRIYKGRQWIQMSVPVSPGNSGGPLFNMRGEVIGITTAKVGGENLNLAIPVNELKKLFKPSYPGRKKFGDKSTPSQW